MKNTRFLSFFAVLLSCLAVGLAGFAPPPSQGVFAELRAGQAVRLEQLAGRWRIDVLKMDKPLELSHTVIEVGSNFIVLEDITGLQQVHVPLTAVLAVVTTRLQPLGQTDNP